LTSFYASMDIPANGMWTEPVHVSGRFLRNIVIGSPLPAVRLVYAGGTLALNDTRISASIVQDESAARRPRYVPTRRLGR
jgi:hypothetical protein